MLTFFLGLFAYYDFSGSISQDQYLRKPSVYPLVWLLRMSVIYCSFPYNGVPYSCVKLVILCCNWCIITSVILPFPAHHRLSARVRCVERIPLDAAFVFHLRAGRAWPSGEPGHSRWIGRRSEEELPHIRHCFKLFYSEMQKANTPKVWIGAMQCIRRRAQCKVLNSAKLLHPFRCDRIIVIVMWYMRTLKVL